MISISGWLAFFRVSRARVFERRRARLSETQYESSKTEEVAKKTRVARPAARKNGKRRSAILAGLRGSKRRFRLFHVFFYFSRFSVFRKIFVKNLKFSVSPSRGVPGELSNRRKTLEGSAETPLRLSGARAARRERKNGRERARARFWPSRGDARGARGRPKHYFLLLFRPPTGESKTWFIHRTLRPNSSPGGVCFRPRAFFCVFRVFAFLRHRVFRPRARKREKTRDRSLLSPRVSLPPHV